VPVYWGAGASSKPRDGYDKWTMAADLHQLVHRELGIQGPISVVGHDLGSMLGFAYALRYRDDVVSLTTMEAPLPGSNYMSSARSPRPPGTSTSTPTPTSPSISPTAENAGTSPASSTT